MLRRPDNMVVDFAEMADRVKARLNPIELAAFLNIEQSFPRVALAYIQIGAWGEDESIAKVLECQDNPYLKAAGESVRELSKHNVLEEI